MPLSSDITSDPKPNISKDEFGNMIILTSDGVAATFKDGRWQPGLLFTLPLPRSRDEFSQVTDEQERARILDAATDALREFRRATPNISSITLDGMKSRGEPTEMHAHSTDQNGLHVLPIVSGSFAYENTLR